jgi:hypothetical protein
MNGRFWRKAAIELYSNVNQIRPSFIGATQNWLRDKTKPPIVWPSFRISLNLAAR